MIHRISAAFAALALFAAPIAAQQLPLVSIGGQTRQLPTSTTLGVRASTTVSASLNIPQGVAPASPSDGDCWITTAGLSCRANGATQSYLSGIVPVANGGTGTTTTSSRFAFIGPAGSSGTPSFRALTGDDVSVTLPYSGAQATNVTTNFSAQPVNFTQFYLSADGVDYSLALQRALNTGRNVFVPPGSYLLLHAVNMAAAGQKIIGSGVTSSVLQIGSSSNAFADLAATGVINIPTTASENEAGLTNIGMVFYQPTTSVRANLIQYPYAVYAQDVARVKIGGTFRLSNCWNGIDLNGNTGGFTAGVLELGCFNRPFLIDGAADTTAIDELKLWPYGSGEPGAPAGLLSIYQDGVAYAQFGRVDGLGINELATFQQRILFTPSVFTTGRALGTIAQLHLDGTFGRLEFSDGYIQVGEWYATTGSGSDYFINQSGGYLTLGPGYLAGPGGSSGSDLIQVSGGKFNYQGGGVIETVATGQAVVGQTGGDVIWVGGSIASGSNQTRTRAFFNTTGGRLSLRNPRFIDIGTGSGNALNVTNNDNHDIEINALLNWGVSLPSSLSAGSYSFDRVFNATPTVTFTTPGDLSVAYTSQVCQYRLVGNRVQVNIQLSFTPTFTTSSGAFVINTGIPYFPSITTTMDFGEVANVTFANQFAGEAVSGTGTIITRFFTSNAGLSNWGTANIISGKAITLNISGSYPI